MVKLHQNHGRRKLVEFTSYENYYGDLIFPVSFRIGMSGILIVGLFLLRYYLSPQERIYFFQILPWYLLGAGFIFAMAGATRARSWGKHQITWVIIFGNLAVISFISSNVIVLYQLESIVLTLSVFIFGALITSPILRLRIFLIPNLVMNSVLLTLLQVAQISGREQIRIMTYSLVLTLFVSFILVSLQEPWRALYDTAKRNYLFSNLDTLTKLLNRRSWYEHSSKSCCGSQRPDHTLGYIMADIDHFKRINDSWGHGCGDLAIQHVSTILVSQIRESDIPGRLGGEEFGILVFTETKEEAQLLAERLRETIETTPLVWNQEVIPITVSMGLAFAHPQEEDWDHLVLDRKSALDDLVHRGDLCLYHAKSQGRNRVVVEDEVALAQES